MRIIRYKYHDELHLGVCINDEVIDITGLKNRRFNSFLDLALEANENKVSIDEFVRSGIIEANSLPTQSLQKT